MEEIFMIIVYGIGFVFLFWLVSMVVGLISSAIFDKADKEAKNGDGKWLMTIIIVAILISVAAWIFGGGSILGNSDNENEYQYRHTDRIY